MRKIILRAIPLIIVWALMGCYGPLNTETTNEVEVSTPLVVIDTPTTIPAHNTPSPVITEQPRVVSPTLPSTKTPYPTLTKKERLKMVQSLLKDNAGCLQCFWGIVPGKTTLSETEGYFRYIGIRTSHIDDRSIQGGFGFDSGMGGYFILGYNAQTQIIEEIEGSYGVLDKATVPKEAWGFYALDHILQEYGKPSEVLFSLSVPHEPTVDERPTYDVIITYSDWKFTLVYNFGRVSYANSKQVTICPNKDQIFYLKLWYGKDHREKMVRNYDPEPIAEVSTVTVEDFHKVYTQVDAANCLSLELSPFEPFP